MFWLLEVFIFVVVVTAKDSIPKRKTSILILLTDDLGWGDVTYIAPSSLYSTPNIDAMADSPNALTMNNFHSSCISCSPTRAAILSGRHCVRDCVWAANAKFDKKSIRFRAEFPFQGNRSESLPAVANRLGYKTMFFGKWHISDLSEVTPYWKFQTWKATGGNAPTFDTTCFCQRDTELCAKGHYGNPKRLSKNYDCNIFDNNIRTRESSRNETSCFNLANHFKESVSKLYSNESFFAVVAFHETHIPFISSPWRRKELQTTTLKDFTSNSSIAADYYGALISVDEAIGDIRNTLALLGRDSDTLIVFTSDNGPERFDIGGFGSTGGLKGRKRSLFEGGHRVPGILLWPEQIKTNIQTDNLISMLDISATIFNVLLKEDPAYFQQLLTRLDGESLLDSLETDSSSSWERSIPLIMCEQAVGPNTPYPCPRLAIMRSNLKLIGKVQKDFGLVSSTVEFYDYKESEDNQISTHPDERSQLLAEANNWAKTVAQGAKRRCRFPRN